MRDKAGSNGFQGGVHGLNLIHCDARANNWRSGRRRNLHSDFVGESNPRIPAHEVLLPTGSSHAAICRI